MLLSRITLLGKKKTFELFDKQSVLKTLSNIYGWVFFLKNASQHLVVHLFHKKNLNQSDIWQGPKYASDKKVSMEKTLVNYKFSNYCR